MAVYRVSPGTLSFCNLLLRGRTMLGQLEECWFMRRLYVGRYTCIYARNMVVHYLV